MTMPGWAVGLGALMKAPEVTNDWVGLYNNINSLRDDSNASEAMQKLSQFRSSSDLAGFQPEGYMRPATRSTLEKLRREKLATLRAQEASPVQAEASRLTRIADNDPYVGGEEGRRDFAERPEFWLGARDTGVMPGAEKGEVVTADGSNPYVASTVQQFGTGNQNILDTFRAGSGDRMALARLSQNKEVSDNFKNATAGVENLDKVDRNARTDAANNKLNTLRATYDLKRTLESRNGFVKAANLIENIDPKLVQSVIKELDDANAAPTGEVLEQFVKNGPNSTRSKVSLDWRGVPVENTRVTSSNNPSDRELGLVPAKDSGEGGQLDVSWIGPDGTAQASRIPRTQLPALKAQLQSQGIKEIDTVDGKRGSKRETLIKPAKGKKGLSLQAPAGAAAPVAKGGFTYVNGKLVAN